jgi:predicted aspartyl protease
MVPLLFSSILWWMSGVECPWLGALSARLSIPDLSSRRLDRTFPRDRIAVASHEFGRVVQVGNRRTPPQREDPKERPSRTNSSSAASDPAKAQDGATFDSALKAAGYQSVPLEQVLGWRVVNAKIAGSPVRLLLDTGSPGTRLDRSRAKSICLEWRATSDSTGDVNADGANLETCLIPRLDAGEFSLPSVRAWAFDLKHFNEDLQEAGEKRLLDGIMGSDILLKYKALIDLKSNRLYLRDPHAPERSDKEAARPWDPATDPQRAAAERILEGAGYKFEKTHQVLGFSLVPVTIKGSTFRFLVDTGTIQTWLYRKRTKSLGLVWSQEGDGGRDDRYSMVLYRSIICELPAMQIAGVELPPCTAGAIELDRLNQIIEPADLGKRVNGILDAVTLSKQKAIIDYASGRLYLKDVLR